jgi:large subunit ribosomal protein L15
MKLHELKPAPGATHKRKRVGRGSGSGHGTYSGRGLKGQKARAGGSINPRFEGGQLPLVRRLPQRRGFTNIFRIEYAEVNLDRLNEFPAGTRVEPTTLAAARIIKSPTKPVKILGNGEIDRPLVVVAQKFSESAKTKITAAGGKAVVFGAPEEIEEEGQKSGDTGEES